MCILSVGFAVSATPVEFRWIVVAKDSTLCVGIIASPSCVTDGLIGAGAGGGAHSTNSFQRRGHSQAHAGVDGLATTAGAWEGASLGGAWGAAAGSFFPGPGNVILGFAGGVVGGVIGGLAASGALAWGSKRIGWN